MFTSPLLRVRARARYRACVCAHTCARVWDRPIGRPVHREPKQQGRSLRHVLSLPGLSATTHKEASPMPGEELTEETYEEMKTRVRAYEQEQRRKERESGKGRKPQDNTRFYETLEVGGFFGTTNLIRISIYKDSKNIAFGIGNINKLFARAAVLMQPTDVANLVSAIERGEEARWEELSSTSKEPDRRTPRTLTLTNSKNSQTISIYTPTEERAKASGILRGPASEELAKLLRAALAVANEAEPPATAETPAKAPGKPATRKRRAET